MAVEVSRVCAGMIVEWTGSSVIQVVRGDWQICPPAFGRPAALAISTNPFKVAVVTKRKRNPIMNVDDDDDDIDDEVPESTTMEEWMRTKPPGFGLTEYDTSLEDRLMAEIEADRIAQAAAKEQKAMEMTKKSAKAVKKPDQSPEGVEVYIGNLPKKRNVDRDLRAAFRSVQGLLHIRPIVGGNDKTREPVCKGLAFLTFASDDNAEDFIQTFNRQKVKFGNTEKKLACELATANSPYKSPVPQKEGFGVPRLAIRKDSSVDLSVTLSTSPSELQSRKESKRGAALDLESVEEHDHDSLDLPEETLRKLEQNIWADLEDEDDYELERELEAEKDSDGSNADVDSDTSESPDPLDARIQGNGQFGQNDDKAEEKDVRQYKDEFGDDKHETEDMVDLKEAGYGRVLSQAYDKKQPTSIADDKEKRIQELESKLKVLELQLKARNSAEFTKEKAAEQAARQSREENLEALEKRVLAKARAALKKDPKIKDADSNMKIIDRRSAPKKATTSKPKLAKENLSAAKARKLGASSRLRKRERTIYANVVSKYYASTVEVAT